jgi:hypothetical protein
MGEPATVVDPAISDRIEALIRRALTEPDNVNMLRAQLHALVPDFHVPPTPPPPAIDEGGERKLKLTLA